MWRLLLLGLGGVHRVELARTGLNLMETLVLTVLPAPRTARLFASPRPRHSLGVQSMIDALIVGRVHGQPVGRTSKNGRQSVTTKLRVPTASGDSFFANTIAFSETVRTGLLALGDGYSVALAGSLTPGIWHDRYGHARVSLDLSAHAVVSPYHVSRKRDAMAKPKKSDNPPSAGFFLVRRRFCIDINHCCHYNNSMQIEFDTAKDAANQAKHGVSLADAAELDWGLLLCRPDMRRDYGELREIGFAPIGARVHCVVFAQRGDSIRIISLRKANSREVQDYAQALEQAGL